MNVNEPLNRPDALAAAEVLRKDIVATVDRLAAWDVLSRAVAEVNALLAQRND
jgi:hypothetical protein